MSDQEPFPDVPIICPEGMEPAISEHVGWWRFDSRDPRVWKWKPFPTPLHRFDPLSGRFRLRYAASTMLGAIHERFGSYGRRRLTEADGTVVASTFTGHTSTIDLTDAQTRAALHVDERISTGRSHPTRPGHNDPLLDACGRLSDRVHNWFRMPPATITFRSRHDAARHNLAFSRDTLALIGDPEEIADSSDLITALLAADVSVPPDWIDRLEVADDPNR